MKHNLLLTALFALTSTLLVAQVAPVAPVDQFLTSAGLVEQQVTSVGSLHGIQVDVLEMKDLIAPGDMKAIRFTSTAAGGAQMVAIDRPEADALLKALNKIEKDVLSSTRKEPTEIMFSGRSGLQVGCMFYPGKPVWRPYVKLQRGATSGVALEPEEFQQFIALIEQAHGKL